MKMMTSSTQAKMIQTSRKRNKKVMYRFDLTNKKQITLEIKNQTDGVLGFWGFGVLGFRV